MDKLSQMDRDGHERQVLPGGYVAIRLPQTEWARQSGSGAHTGRTLGYHWKLCPYNLSSINAKGCSDKFTYYDNPKHSFQLYLGL